jgi:hypothetical protein
VYPRRYRRVVTCGSIRGITDAWCSFRRKKGHCSGGRRPFDEIRVVHCLSKSTGWQISEYCACSCPVDGRGNLIRRSCHRVALRLCDTIGSFCHCECSCYSFLSGVIPRVSLCYCCRNVDRRESVCYELRIAFCPNPSKADIRGSGCREYG